MKTAFSLISWIIICNNTVSQPTRFDSNFVWTESHNNAFSPNTDSRKVVLSATPTLINSLTYYALLSTDSFDGIEWDTSNTYIRTSNDKVYLRRYDKEILLYDFAAEIGDKFNTYHELELEVIMVDSVILANGESRRRLKLVCTWDITLEPTYWIEGIGSNMGFDQGSVCQFDWYTTSLCTYYKNELIYKNPEDDTCWLEITSINDHKPINNIQIFPNPVREALTITDVDRVIDNVKIYSLSKILLFSGSNDQINMEKFEAGCYLLNIKFENGQSFTQIIIKI